MPRSHPHRGRRPHPDPYSSSFPSVLSPSLSHAPVLALSPSCPYPHPCLCYIPIPITPPFFITVFIPIPLLTLPLSPSPSLFLSHAPPSCPHPHPHPTPILVPVPPLLTVLSPPRAALHRAAPPGAAPHHGGCGSPPIPSPRATPHRRAGSERALTETRYETKPCYVKMPRGLRAERGGPQPLTWHRIQRRRRLRLRRPVAPRLGTQLWHARVRRLWPRSGLGTEGEELPVGAQHGAGGGEAGWALQSRTAGGGRPDTEPPTRATFPRRALGCTWGRRPSPSSCSTLGAPVPGIGGSGQGAGGTGSGVGAGAALLSSCTRTVGTDPPGVDCVVQSAAQLGVGAWRAAVLLELSVGKLRAAAAFLRTGILLGRVVSPLGLQGTAQGSEGLSGAPGLGRGWGSHGLGQRRGHASTYPGCSRALLAFSFLGNTCREERTTLGPVPSRCNCGCAVPQPHIPQSPGEAARPLAPPLHSPTCSSMVPCAAPALLPPPCGASCSL